MSSILSLVDAVHSAYFDTHHNVLVYKAIGAAYGGASLKSDFGGHSNHHHHNIDLFFSRGFSICSQLQASGLSTFALCRI
jgi:hypothetical protein